MTKKIGLAICVVDCLKLLLFVPHVHHARLNSVMHNFAKLKFTFHDGWENCMYVTESRIGLALQNEGVGNQCGYVRPSLKYHKKQNEPN